MPDSPSKRAREAKKRRKHEEKQERKRARKLGALATTSEGADLPAMTGTLPEIKETPVEPPKQD